MKVIVKFKIKIIFQKLIKLYIKFIGFHELLIKN
jgi:hypothetical protein